MYAMCRTRTIVIHVRHDHSLFLGMRTKQQNGDLCELLNPKDVIMQSGSEEVPLSIPLALQQHLEDDCYWISRKDKVD